MSEDIRVMKKRVMPSVEQLSLLACTMGACGNPEDSVEKALEIWREAGDLLEQWNPRDHFAPECAERIIQEYEPLKKVFRGESLLLLDEFLRRAWNDIIDEKYQLKAFREYVALSCGESDPYNCEACKRKVVKYQEKGITSLNGELYITGSSDIISFAYKWEAERKRKAKEQDKNLNSAEVDGLIDALMEKGEKERAVMVALLAGSGGEGGVASLYKGFLKAKSGFSSISEERKGVFKKISQKAADKVQDLQKGKDIDFKGLVEDASSFSKGLRDVCLELKFISEDMSFKTDRLLDAYRD